jgi:hypothetical protein
MQPCVRGLFLPRDEDVVAALALMFGNAFVSILPSSRIMSFDMVACFRSTLRLHLTRATPQEVPLAAETLSDVLLARVFSSLGVLGLG